MIPEREFPVTAFYTIELLIEYEKDGRKVTDENGLRIIWGYGHHERYGFRCYNVWPSKNPDNWIKRFEETAEKDFNMTAVRIALILCFFPLIAHAGVYKWVDANGQVHFGDRPPSKASSREVKINAAPPQRDPTAQQRHQKMTEFLNEQQLEREERQAVEQRERREAQKQAELCRKYQARLKHMASISTFYNLNEKGERVFVSESENEAIRQRYRQKVSEACGS